ncbi:phosphodiester glycosidase family protein [Lactococcus insecticola]|nr:phosphodiester glycosidase family protein [Lactococcus insecticola]
MKRNQKKKSKAWLIWLLLVIIVAAIAAVLIVKPFSKSKTTTAPSSSKNAPIKVNPSQSATIISSSSVVASDDTQKVASAGEAGWVQVKSKGTADKFTDMSKGDVTIYKAHNPKVLKTATSDNPTLQVLPDVMAQYPNALIMNTSGFNMSTGQITGFQINNGKLFTNWGENKRANTAFVINKDGSSTVYDSSTPASEILAKGAEQSYSFGSILIKNGVVQPDDGSVNWMIHSYLANDADNNIYVMVAATGVAYQGIMDTVSDMHLKDLVVMDGGGSSQMGFKGQTLVASQDNRQVGDFIVLK